MCGQLSQANIVSGLGHYYYTFTRAGSHAVTAVRAYPHAYRTLLPTSNRKSQAASIRLHGQEHFDTRVKAGREKSGVAGREREAKEQEKAQEVTAAKDKLDPCVTATRASLHGTAHSSAHCTRYRAYCAQNPSAASAEHAKPPQFQDPGRVV